MWSWGPLYKLRPKDTKKMDDIRNKDCQREVKQNPTVNYMTVKEEGDQEARKDSQVIEVLDVKNYRMLGVMLGLTK